MLLAACRLSLVSLFGLSFGAMGSDDFMWGVANSAFQVEGNPEASDWARWTKTPGKIHDGTIADRATDFWNRYEEDFDLAAALGVGTFRMSIAWERIEPQAGRWNEDALDHYEKMIEAMRKRGLEPLITLHHFVLPTWIADRGGLEFKEFPRYFTRYAMKVVSRLSARPARVKWWMTFNESMGQVAAGYLSPLWPPGVFDTTRATQAAANLIRAHISSTLALRTLRGGRALRIGLAHNWRPFYPAAKLSLADRVIAGQAESIYNKNYLDSVSTGKIKVGFPGAKTVRETIEVPKGVKLLDYVGINYYGRYMIQMIFKSPFVRLFEGPGPKTDMGWEIFPQGLYPVLKKAYARYKLPILISENGIADANDSRRTDYIEDHVRQIGRARNEGVPVIGYLHWSLTDNFEWAEGLKPRFGLVEVDYETQVRRPRASYTAFSKLLLSRSIGPIKTVPDSQR
jgi:beta-glucosidase